MKLTTKDLNAILKRIEFMEKSMEETNKLDIKDRHRTTLYPTRVE